MDQAIGAVTDLDQLVIAIMLWKFLRCQAITSNADSNLNPKIMGQNADVSVQALRMLRNLDKVTPAVAIGLRDRFMQLLEKIGTISITIEDVEWNTSIPKRSAVRSTKPKKGKPSSKPKSKSKR